VLVARHENQIGDTTDVDAHEEFAARRRTQLIDGVPVTGWFTEDFTLAELRTLRARERLPLLRPDNARHDGEFSIPTFDEILALLAQVNAARRAQALPLVGVYPETKHPTHFANLGLPLEAPLLASLAAHGQGAPVFIQSFESGNLQALHERCDHPLVQLMQMDGGPWDRAGRDDFSTYAQMATPAGLKHVATYAQAIGVEKEMVLKREAGAKPVPSELVHHAHAAGLAVHAWTFRAENHFLPAALRRGVNPQDHGDLAAQVRAYCEAGIDGLFSDHPALARSGRVYDGRECGLHR
jgi:glycerophosphoryl diester phosphodiesterase